MQNKAIASASEGELAPPEASRQQILAAFFDSAVIGFGIFDSHLRFQAANDALSRMDGLPAAASAARWDIDGFAQRSGIKVNLHLPADFARLPERVEMALFRVLQESLTNVYRHAKTSAVDIRLERNNGSVALEVRDYGRGISPEQLQRLQEPSSIGSVGVAVCRNGCGNSEAVWRFDPIRTKRW